MTSEPSEDAIDEFVTITNVTRQQAIHFLKANNLDSHRAINAYFENPSCAQPEAPETWQMSSSQQGRFAYQNQNVPSFRIDNSDPPIGSGYASAPSRPPSRVGSHDTHEGIKIGDPITVSVDQLVGTSQKMSAAEQEEHELQQAVAMSLNADLGGVGGGDGGQETGVITSGHTHFGPASRDHYEETSWALTLLGSSGQEVIISPDPEDRRKAPDEPAFLRPSEEAEHLAGFLTILHSIPLAREALLLRDNVAPGYGHDLQWWSGQPISLPRLVSLEDADYTDDNDGDDILLEAQRLMAFLDSTNRAFGSCDGLTGLRSVRPFNPDLIIDKFLNSWQETAVSATGNQLAAIFSSLALKRPFFKEDEPIDRDFFVLHVKVSPTAGETLYQILDGLIWADRTDTELDDVWLGHVGEVFTMRLASNSISQKGIGVEIPAVWFPDRYLESCKDLARQLRTHRVKTMVELERLDGLIERFSISSAVGNRDLPLVATLDKALVGSRVARRANHTNGTIESGNGPGETVVSHEEGQKLARELRAIMDTVDQKLKSLEERKKRALESLKLYSNVLTKPAASPHEPPHHRYTLRGVCTLPHVTYVLKRRTADLAESGNGSENQASDGWQWWRLSFSVDDAKLRVAEANRTSAVPSTGNTSAAGEASKRSRVSVPSNADVLGYTARRVREVEVLRAAKEESPTVLLVYASENAINFKEDAAPQPLQAFVETDNKSFELELQNAAIGFQEEMTQSHDTSYWGTSEPVAGPSDLPRLLNNTQSKPSVVPQDGKNRQGKKLSYDDRLPASFMPSESVNTFHEVSLSSDDQDDETGKELEMQERNGRGFLTQARQHRIVNPPAAMDQIQEEADNESENTPVSCGKSMNPA